ncbi:hypothetical protein [Micromonospora aurantiaca (nom. illeg.)]|uniref:hypothetical protein n=1 Tax=Micromonospora aurantiaca (nom. illeg.) TaxID=47850 RepID=UPI0011AB13C5|nr:hypothetical protein [Micromonospora aurantiaca]MBC9000544.1 hypothetical protein [Micromonospora aurantiaca]
MPFGITYDNRITFFLRDVDGAVLRVHPATQAQVIEARSKVGDPTAVIETTTGGMTRMLPMRSVLYTEIDQVSNLDKATVELYQDAAGCLYLRDPEEPTARYIGEPAPNQFIPDARALIEGDWEFDVESNPHRGLDGLTLIATYRKGIHFADVVFTPGDDPTPVAGEMGAKYIGKQWLRPRPTLA